jgi:hypothetical protein
MEYQSQRRNLRSVDLSPDCDRQDFFIVLCSDYEAAARFVLDWATSNINHAGRFVAAVLTIVREELNLASCELQPINPATTKVRSPGGSVCRIALLRFCELLNENPTLIQNIQSQPDYATEGGVDFFANREGNTIALTRGTSWEARGFKDPLPISPSALQNYHERERSIAALERERKEKEQLAKEELTRQKKQRQYAEAKIKQENISRESKRRRLFREEFLRWPLILQVSNLATDDTWPVTAFPIDPEEITEDILRQLSDDSLNKLDGRIAGRWEARWRKLRTRIQTVLSPRSETTE